MDDIRPTKLQVHRDETVARDYDQRWSGALSKKRDLRKAFDVLRDHHHGESFEKVLDIPCGTGRFSDLFDTRDCHTIGVDLSIEMLQQARAKHPQQDFFCANIGRLPFGDNAIATA